jgi:hypothetical protein
MQLDSCAWRFNSDNCSLGSSGRAQNDTTGCPKIVFAVLHTKESTAMHSDDDKLNLCRCGLQTDVFVRIRLYESIFMVAEKSKVL